MKEGVLFVTYSSLVASRKGRTLKKLSKSRLDQVIKWCGGESFDGCIMFDECHRAKNFIMGGKGKSTRSGQAVFDMQEALPLARVVYCSATGVTDPVNMGYMTRLGLWGEGTSFPRGFNEFLGAIGKGGIGRKRCFQFWEFVTCVAFRDDGAGGDAAQAVWGVHASPEVSSASSDEKNIYDRAAALWQLLYSELTQGLADGSLVYPTIRPIIVEDGPSDIEEDFDDMADLLDTDNPKCALRVPAGLEPKGTVMRYFWASHQRFFRSLCISMKVPTAVHIARKALTDSKSVVIGLQNTGESAMKTAIDSATEDDLDDFISSPAITLQNVIYKLFPLPQRPHGACPDANSSDNMESHCRGNISSRLRSTQQPSTLPESTRKHVVISESSNSEPLSCADDSEEDEKVHSLREMHEEGWLFAGDANADNYVGK
ncbi:FGT1, partial [Symbiodinium microadriaticum]